MIPQLRDELIRDEGMRLNAYRDSVGLWTIGVGHLLGDRMRMVEITTAEAHALLEADVAEAERLLNQLLPSRAPGPVRERALVNMAFNLGGRLGQFKKFLAAVKTQDWMTAGREMADSKWAAQVGQRAVRLRKMIETGAV